MKEKKKSKLNIGFVTGWMAKDKIGSNGNKQKHIKQK